MIKGLGYNYTMLYKYEKKSKFDISQYKKGVA